jgi:hypothetical protein
MSRSNRRAARAPVGCAAVVAFGILLGASGCGGNRGDTNEEVLSAIAELRDALEQLRGDLLNVKGEPKWVTVAPDLVVLPESGSGPALCTRTEDGKLVVTVANHGDAPMAFPPKVPVFVRYFRGEFEDPPAHFRGAFIEQSLAPGDSVELEFEMPASCFGADCPFRIDVDPADFVFEWDEENNDRGGDCIG